jgi:NADPH2:quinone reductase
MMKTICMTAIGGTDVLQAQTMPIPTLKSSTDIKVRLHAAGINPIVTLSQRNITRCFRVRWCR